ncbi:MAG: TolC family protein [Steroidobacteraceae bacterium]
MKYLAILLATTAIASCAYIPDERLERDVRQIVRTRADVEASWHRDADAQRVALEKAKALLADGLGLEEAVQVALLANPDLQIEFERLGIARAEYIDAITLPNPVVFASRRRVEDGDGHQTEYGLVQNILALVRLPIERRVASFELQAAKLHMANAVIALAANTRVAYYELAAKRRLARLHDQHADAGRLRLELAERYYTAGNIAAAEREEQRDAAVASRHAQAAAQRELAAATAVLERLLGGLSIADVELSDRLAPVPAQDPEFAPLLARALEQNLQIDAYRREVDARTAGRQAIRRTRWLDELSVGVSTEQDPDGTRLTGPDVEFPLPLFSQRQAEVARGDAVARLAMREAEAAALNLREQLELAFARLVEHRRNVVMLRDELLPARERLRDSEQRRQFFMLEGPFAPLAARQLELEGYEQFIAEVGAYWAARAQLAALCGNCEAMLGAP